MPTAPPAVRPAQFAFRATLNLADDAAWPARIWEALAAAGGVKGPVHEEYFGATPRYPAKLSGVVEVGANVLSTKAPRGNPQLVTLSFAAFDPKTGAPLGWSRDHDGGTSDPGLFGGFRVKNGQPDHGAPVKIDEAFLRKLMQEGKRLRKAAAAPMAHDADVFALTFAGPEGARLVSLGNDHVLRVWDPIARASVTKSKVHRFSYRFAAGRDHAVAGGPQAKVLSLQNGATLATLKAKMALDTVALSPDGTWVAAGAGEDVIAYDLQGNVLRSTPLGEFVHDLSVSSDGRVAVVVDSPALVVIDPKGSVSGRIAIPVSERCVWTPAGLFAWNGELLHVDIDANRVERVAAGAPILGVSPDGTVALLGGGDNVALVSTAGGETIRTIAGAAKAAALDPANRRLAVAAGKNISVIDL